MIEATLVGDWPAIEAYAAQASADLGNMTVIHEPAPQAAAGKVIELARNGSVGVVVKGQVKTSALLSAALNRHIGLRGRGILSHVGIFELPGEKLLSIVSPSTYNSCQYAALHVQFI